MICKACGAVFSGQQCPKCGEKVILAGRSMGLDYLMQSEQRETTEKQHLQEDYQRGLQIGYENGLKDGEKRARINGTALGKRKILPKPLLYAVTLLVIFIGIYCSYQAGLNTGYEEQNISLRLQFEREREQYTTDKDQALESQYLAGRDEGEIIGYEKGHEEGFKTGWEQGYEEASAQAAAGDSYIYSDNVLLFSTGEKNAGVKTIQRILSELSIYNGDIDGDYGKQTESAIKRFQESMNLNITGNTDLQTFILLLENESALEEASGKPVETREDTLNINPELSPVRPHQINHSR